MPSDQLTKSSLKVLCLFDTFKKTRSIWLRCASKRREKIQSEYLKLFLDAVTRNAGKNEYLSLRLQIPAGHVISMALLVLKRCYTAQHKLHFTHVSLHTE
jgi:hypothetical protein